MEVFVVLNSEGCLVGNRVFSRREDADLTAKGYPNCISSNPLTLVNSLESKELLRIKARQGNDVITLNRSEDGVYTSNASQALRSRLILFHEGNLAAHDLTGMLADYDKVYKDGNLVASLDDFRCQ